MTPEPPYGPPDASKAPRYTGVRTFARCPYVEAPDGVDVGFVGIPFDTATSFRPGARFGPEGIRAASQLLRPYHPPLDVDVFAGRAVADLGDLDVTPGNAEKTAAQIAEGLGAIAAAGVTPIVLGGDHSVVLGELRAHHAKHGPLALVLLDAHADTWDQYYGERYFHGTPFRRAVEEGLLLPERSVLGGMRGPLYGPGDLQDARDMGFDLLTGEEMHALGPDGWGTRVRERVGDAPAYFSFDVDFLDPAYAPGTGTPEVGGASTADAQRLLRSLAGMSFVGFDVVEVSPPYDSPGQQTALAAANIVYEMLALTAIATR
jgi:agmatinase